MSKKIDIKWERNSRVMALVAQNRIDFDDVIPRTQTDKFPSETCTVRMARMNEKIPFITLHIRGKGVTKTNTYNNYTWTNSHTCRVNFGGSYDSTMCSNGLLDEDYSWQDVHNLVEEVKEVMEI